MKQPAFRDDSKRYADEQNSPAATLPAERMIMNMKLKKIGSYVISLLRLILPTIAGLIISVICFYSVIITMYICYMEP